MNKGKPLHIRGAGGLGVCGRPAGAFSISDYGRALFLSACGEPVCDDCLKDKRWSGAAALAYREEIAGKTG